MTQKSPNMLLRKAARMALALLLLGCTGFLILLLSLTYAEKHVPAPTGQYDAVIVLGAQVKEDGTPSRQLRLRLEGALSQYHKNPSLIITTGAKGANEPAPEGDVMKQWLLDAAVPEQDVISENQSFNTWQNLRNAKAILGEDAHRVVIVTSDYHLPRAMWIARDLGLSADGIGTPTTPEWWVKNHVREVLAWCKYLVGKVLPIN